MAHIFPFKAIRPTVDKVAHVVSRSYQEYSRRELNAILSYNPYSFLHIINPGYKYAKNVTGKERFHLVRNRYLEFLEDGIFKRDERPGFYLYRVTHADFSCCGLFCSTSVADYRADDIKKHEDTLHRREVLFADYLDTVGFNAEPVLMTYGDNNAIAELLATERQRPADIRFSTTDKVLHELWPLSDTHTVNELQKAFSQIGPLYIADGHHRSASSELLARNRENEASGTTREETHNFFMSYLIPDSEIRIFEFNRMVKGLNGLSKEEFLIRLDSFYRIENKGQLLYKPSKKHHFSMYLDGEFYSLYLRKNKMVLTDPLSTLDTQILFKTILEPMLGILDLRTDKRIRYDHGKHNALTMKDAIDQGSFTVGFGMVPATMNEIKAIADAGLTMPPKSTYIEPKLRSGLAIYEL